MFGSGTHGLQSLTRSPPPRLATSAELPIRAGSLAGRVRELAGGSGSPSTGS